MIVDDPAPVDRAGREVDAEAVAELGEERDPPAPLGLRRRPEVGGDADPDSLTLTPGGEERDRAAEDVVEAGRRRVGDRKSVV